MTRAAVTGVRFIAPLRDWVERIVEALADPKRGNRTVLILLVGYVLVWCLYAVVAKNGQDIHFDMGEMAAWSRQAGLGTPKHPPLGPWLVRLWFDFLPRRDWAYYLFALCLPAIALWLTWLTSLRFMPRENCVFGLALLSLIPFFNLFAIKFNANSLLTPLWALATYTFIRSYQTRSMGWSILAGAAAAAAMLGKYWSIVLLAGLGLAALADRRRRDYFASRAPLLTLGVGTALITPHLDWLIANHFVTFGYAMEMHSTTFWGAIPSVAAFVFGGAAYAVVPILIGIVLARPDRAVILDTLWPSDPDRRFILVAFGAPFLFGCLIAIALQVGVHAIWTMSMLTLLPVALCSSPLIRITRNGLVGAVAVAIAFPFFMLAIAPAVAVADFGRDVDNYGDEYRLLAQAMQTAWARQTSVPLRVIGGPDAIVNGASFYFDRPPRTLVIYRPAETPWVDQETVQKDGLAIVCPESVTPCVRLLDAYAERYHAKVVEHVTVSRCHCGLNAVRNRFEIAVILPASRQSGQRVSR